MLERMGAENRIAGEFYIPRSVIGFMVDVIAPEISETGSAGFLFAAYEAMQRQRRTLVKQQSTERQASENRNGTLLAELEQTILAQTFRREL